jgi:hypothetical protein
VGTTTLTFQSTVAVLVKNSPLGCKTCYEYCVLVSNASDNTAELNVLPSVQHNRGSDGYEMWYLFRKGETCCTKYFPSSSNCPYEDESQANSGYYWEKYQDNLPNGAAYPTIYNHTFYPDMNTCTCVGGTNYPAWMASEKNLHSALPLQE